jgi:hypothetical protein
MFNPSNCEIPEIWCGVSDVIPKTKGKTYYKIGTRSECLKKGYGAGFYSNKKSGIPDTSLQHIKYVGEIHEQSFRRAGIRNLSNLERETRRKTSKEISMLLKRILTKSGGALDTRAYNSVLMYLYQHGNSNLPSCKKIVP